MKVSNLLYGDLQPKPYMIPYMKPYMILLQHLRK